jgi:hypothetical protein
VAEFLDSLVVVGVALELFVLIVEYVHEWKDFKRRVIHSPDKPSIALFILGILAAALVFLGVAGEFSVHTKAGKLEADMRDTSRRLVSIADRDAAEAARQAE